MGTTQFHTTLNLANGTVIPSFLVKDGNVTVDIYQNGSIIGTQNVSVGVLQSGPLNIAVNQTASGPVSVALRTYGQVNNPNGGVTSTGNLSDTGALPVLITQGNASGGSLVVDPAGANVTANINYSDWFNNPPAAGNMPMYTQPVVWTNPTSYNMSYNATADPLTLATYQQGVVQQVTHQQADTTALVSALGNLSVNVTPITDRQDAAAGVYNATQGNLSTAAQAFASTLSGAISSAALAAVTAVEDALPVVGNVSVPVTGPGSASVLAVVPPGLLTGGHSLTFDLDPADYPVVVTVFSWLRFFIAWLVVYKTFAWLLERMTAEIKVQVGAGQAHGNPVAAGTGAQASAFVNAGLAVVIVVASVVALAALYDSWDAGMSFSGTFKGVNPMASAPSVLIYLAQFFLPMNTIFAAIVVRVSAQVFFWPIIVVRQMLILFLVT